MNFFNDVWINWFSDMYSIDFEIVNLSRVLEDIRCGRYSHLIEKCRKLYLSQQYSQYKIEKVKLPAVTFSGTFHSRRRSDNLLSYSGLVVLDIDKIDTFNIDSIKNRLVLDPFVAALWVSPSCCGLKVLVRVSDGMEQHRLNFDSLVVYMRQNYDVEVDKSGSDVCRLCFMSYDISLYYNLNYKIYSYKEFSYEISRKEIKFVINDRSRENDLFIEKNTNFFKTEGKNKRNKREMLDRILSFLRKNNLSITDSYDSWYKVSLAIANSFTYDLGEKYFLKFCSLDGDKHDEYKSRHLLEYCYRNKREGEVSIATVVYYAQRKGFVVKSDASERRGKNSLF